MQELYRLGGQSERQLSPRLAPLPERIKGTSLKQIFYGPPRTRDQRPGQQGEKRPEAVLRSELTISHKYGNIQK